MSDALPPSPAPAPAAEPARPARRTPSVGAGLAIDYGPLVIFFLANAFAPVPDALKVFAATGIFMVAMLIAMLISYLRYGRISPLLWFSGVMVLVLGGLTLWLHQEWFIKIKPTLYYLTVAAILGFGLRTGRNLLKTALGPVYPGLSERGWYLLTRNWVVLFIGMAILNEIIWRSTSTSFWLGSKLWLFVPATFIFIACNVPMLIRHGLTLEEAAKEPPIAPVD
jgi:intracellular septation protein